MVTQGWELTVLIKRLDDVFFPIKESEANAEQKYNKRASNLFFSGKGERNGTHVYTCLQTSSIYLSTYICLPFY